MNYFAKISLWSSLFLQAALLAYGGDDFSKIKIISATYGSGQKQADVKEKITDLLVTHPDVVRVSPSCLGIDPTPGWNKELRITYIYNGTECSLHWGENSSFTSLALCQAAAKAAVPPAPSSAPVAATSPAPAASAEPGVLDVLSQNALDATDWILAPLEQIVPPTIRRNLTAMREDLLDEGKKNPRAGAESYRAGYQLCNAMIGALDEREQTRVRAGYRATEAITITPATNQALEARRNYKMRWPQYKREQAQREEVKRIAEGNDSKHLQLTIERIKIDWSDRTAKLHQNLDALYAHFRESVRQETVHAKASN